jgi:hypothetical protein
MSSITATCFIFGLLASFIGIYVIKTNHWVDFSKHSLERIDTEGNEATCMGVFFLILGIILIVLGLVSLV